MVGRGEARTAARLICTAAAGLACAAPAIAQEQTPQQPPPTQPAPLATPADPAELDPSAPLAPLPDLGVDWPDVDSDGLAPEPIAPATGKAIAQPPPAAQGASELRYELVLTGLDSVGDRDALVDAFDERSALHAGGSANAAQIDRRSSEDAELLAELLRSKGYYDAMVEPAVERVNGVLTVTLEAQPGVQYRFASVDLPGLSAAGEDADALRKAFAVKAGDTVDAEQVIAAGIALKVALGEEGFATAEVGEQQIEIDHETQSASLVLPVTPGPVARFGAIHVSGKPPFGSKHVQTIARFKRGDRFERSEVDDLRRALVATGLVSTAEVRVVPADGGRIANIDVHLEPAPVHTIAGELGYGTGEGIRAEASWQHRNFINPEGALTLRGVLGTREQLASAQLRRNNFRGRDRVLNLLVSASHSDLQAYEAKTALLSASLERQTNIIWPKKWTWSFGADLIATDERGVFDPTLTKSTKTFFIAAAPATLYYDGSDDLLNPTRGFRLGGRLSPEISAHGGSFAYAKAQIDASYYQPVSDSTVAAGRIRLGTIVGARSFEIAPSRRFYAGGGGSVRGYGYQELGPQDVDGDPIGGRSLAEFSLEARIRLKAFGGNFGVVPFLDGGTLSRKSTPDLTHWQFGAGLGFRYYSSFGPIRVDVGTPLNHRSGHAAVAVAVSLGQAF
jgi:translocation and assembly module TamA